MTPIRLSTALLAAVATLAPFVDSVAAPKIYRYENTVGGSVTYVSTNNNCAAGTGARNIQFSVTDSFTVQSISVGLNISHTERGDIRVVLEAPDGTDILAVAQQGTDTDDNYDILVAEGFDDDDGESVRPNLDDNDTDPVAEPYYVRLVENTNINGYTGNANGTWTLRVCDRDDNSINGTLNRAKLILTENATVSQNTCTGTRLTYDWGSNGNNADFTSATVGGVTITETRATSLGSASVTGNLRTSTVTTGNHTGFYMFLVDVPTSSDTTRIEQVGQMTEFTFSTEVNDLTFSILDNDWADSDFEDYTVIAGYDADGNYVPWEYTGGSATQRAGDVIEGDAGAADNETTANLNVEFAGAVKRVLVDYLVGDDWESTGGLPDDQRTGITDLSFCGFDYGDAPSSYNVSLSGNGPRHVLRDRDLFLGATRPDGESDGAGNTNANLDGADEDGIASWPVYVSSGMTCGSYTSAAGEYCASVTLTNNFASAAQLVGWIDFNGDGDFNDAGERSLPRLGGGTGGAADNTFTTGNIAASSGSQTRVLVWSGFGIPVNASTATYGRIRLTTEPSFFSDTSPQPNGLVRDGEVEDYLLPVGTLPVSLANVRSSLGPEGWLIEFSTATEAGNIGFDIIGDTGRLTRQPIPAAELGVSGGDYRVLLPAGALKEFWIEDIATDGARKAHGPFRAGQAYGTEPDTSRIDWTAIRDALPEPARAKSGARSLLLGNTATGIHRIGFEALAAAGLSLGRGVDSQRLALADGGKAVALHVADGGDGLFGPGDHLEYFARETGNRYSATNWLTLTIGAPRLVPTVLPTLRTALPKIVPAVFTQEVDRQFNLSIEGAAPWVDDRLLAYDQPVSLSRTFVLPAMAPLTPVRAEVSVLGGTDLANPGPDHSVVASLNGRHRATARFDGAVPKTLAIDIPGGLLPGTQELSIEVAADLGLPFDLVHYDRLSVQYLRYTHAVDGLFEARFDAGDGFALGGLNQGGSLWAVGQGGSWRLDVAAGMPVSVGNPFAGNELEWFAASPDRFRTPQVRAEAAAAGLPEAADFLVIVHPSLAPASADYIALQKSRGYRVAVVDTDAIYARLADHEPSADAIRQFIRDTHARTALKFVTLVGADTYDYRNLLGTGSISYVPTHYLKTSAYIAQTPSDALHADVDGDQVADIAIGRIPARTPDEMLRMTRKIRQLGARTLDAALFVAGGDTSGAKRFGGLSLDFATGLPATTRTSIVQLDEYTRNDVRQAVLDGFNAGTPLISYTGHTAPSLWDFSGLLFAQDAATLKNGGAPSLVTQWGCWNSYFVDPYAQGLSHQLLAAEGGAGTIYGATTLTEDASHSLLGQLFFEAVGAGARTLGEAELVAKRRLAELRPEARDAQLGMQILGDPALPIRLP